MSNDLRELYQEVILDHNKSPRNFRKMADANHVAEGHNPLCGDQVKVYLKLEGDTIRDIAFEGSGCAISKASASMMTSALKGKTIGEARELFDKFHDTVTTGESENPDLGKLVVFAGVHDYPTRVKCAILSWHAMLSAIEDKKQPVTTE